jgi:hypothetical protein
VVAQVLRVRIVTAAGVRIMPYPVSPVVVVVVVVSAPKGVV